MVIPIQIPFRPKGADRAKAKGTRSTFVVMLINEGGSVLPIPRKIPALTASRHMASWQKAKIRRYCPPKIISSGGVLKNIAKRRSPRKNRAKLTMIPQAAITRKAMFRPLFMRCHLPAPKFCPVKAVMAEPKPPPISQDKDSICPPTRITL